MRFERLNKLAVLAGALFAAATGIARFLVASDNATTVEHFGVYLLGQMWPELVFGAVFYTAFWWLRRSVAALRSQLYSGTAFETLIARNPIQMLLVAVAVVLVISPSFFFIRGRYVFWTELSRRAYVETYTQRIDSLAAAGKVQDAFNLANRVVAAVGDDAEHYYLADRVSELAQHVQRSDALTKASGRTWNPITGREEFFQLVEAIRLNPQNYVAADRVRQMLAVVQCDLPGDISAICDADTSLRRFSGRIRSMLEAQVQRAEAAGADCSEQQARQSWGIHTVTCLLYLSEATKPGNPSVGCRETPSDFWEDLPDKWKPEPLGHHDVESDDYMVGFPSPLEAARAIWKGVSYRLN